MFTDFFDVRLWDDFFGDDASFDECFSDGAVVDDVLFGDARLCFEVVMFGIVDGDFGREIFGFEEDSGHEVSKRLCLFDASFGFHSLCGSTEEGSVSFATNERKVFVTTCLFENNFGEFVLCFAEFFASEYSFVESYFFLQNFKFSGLCGKIGLRKSYF